MTTGLLVAARVMMKSRDGSRKGKRVLPDEKCVRTARENASKLQSVLVGPARFSSVPVETGRDERMHAVCWAPHGMLQSYVSVMPWITWDSSLAFSTAMLSPL